jgi:large subunit ribosomal protein L24
VLSGKDKGRTGTVLEMITKTDRVLVQGLNMVKRHTKQSQTSEGGIVAKEASIHISNLALADPKDGKPTRVGIKTNDDGTKVRFAKRSGDLIDG